MRAALKVSLIGCPKTRRVHHPVVGLNSYTAALAKHHRPYRSLTIHAQQDTSSEKSEENQEKTGSNRDKQPPEKGPRDEASMKTQTELASRVDALVEDQMQEAIERQVGATRADWTDASDGEEEERPRSKTAPIKTFEDGTLLYTSEQFE